MFYFIIWFNNNATGHKYIDVEAPIVDQKNHLYMRCQKYHLVNQWTTLTYTIVNEEGHHLATTQAQGTL